MEDNHNNQNYQAANNGAKNSQQQQVLEQEQNRLLAEIKDKLSDQLKPKNILQTIVADIRQLLKCDRVLIYNLSIANDGVVIAESVADGWTKVLAQAAKNS